MQKWIIYEWEYGMCLGLNSLTKYVVSYCTDLSIISIIYIWFYN